MDSDAGRLNRFRGCLLGLAVGDALGAPLVGMKPGHVAQMYGRTEGYVDPEVAWKGKPWRWTLRGLYTGNTQKALALTDILARDGRCEPRALADVLVEMAGARVAGGPLGCFRRPSRFLRNTVEQLGASGADPLACGGPSAGSGAAARVAPLGLHFRDAPECLIEAAIETSLVTHADPRAILAAVAVALAVGIHASGTTDETRRSSEIARWLIEQVNAAERCLLDRYGRYLSRTADEASSRFAQSLAIVPRLLEEGDDALAFDSIVREANRCGPDHVIHDPGDGFAPAAVTAALYLGLGGRSFAEALPVAVGLGRQAHDLGAIVGALVGARDGVESIPRPWMEQLLNADQVRLRADNLERGDIDYARWRGVVDLESEATAAEERERRQLTQRWEKQGVLAAKKPKRAKAKPAPEPELGFAPPPETWLRRERGDRRRSRGKPRRRER